MKKYFVEIRLRKSLFDPAGEETKRIIEEFGFTTVSQVEVSHYYAISGDITRPLVERIAKELLLDPVSQQMKVSQQNREEKGVITVDVWYKPEVTDPTVFTVLKGIRDLGISVDLSVACGKKYRIYGTLQLNEIDTLCRKVLVNTLIQNFTVTSGDEKTAL
jgi:phosphoribosylformylglycinamidine (FGAM) synthase PurS component